MKEIVLFVIQIGLLWIGFTKLPRDLFLTLLTVSQSLSFCYLGYKHGFSLKTALATFCAAGFTVPLAINTTYLSSNWLLALTESNLLLVAGGMNVVGYLAGVLLKHK